MSKRPGDETDGAAETKKGKQVRVWCDGWYVPRSGVPTRESARECVRGGRGARAERRIHTTTHSPRGIV